MAIDSHEPLPDPRWKSGLHFAEEWEKSVFKRRRVQPLVLQLPHSCDEWVIGGLEDARLFLSDLTEAVAEMERLASEEVKP